MKVIESLLGERACLRLHDPRAIPNLKKSLPEKEGAIVYCDSPYSAATGADAVLILTEWPNIANLTSSVCAN